MKTLIIVKVIIKTSPLGRLYVLGTISVVRSDLICDTGTCVHMYFYNELWDMP